MECSSAFEVNFSFMPFDNWGLEHNFSFSNSTIFTRHLSSVDGGDDSHGVGEEDRVDSFDAEQGAEPNQ